MTHPRPRVKVLMVLIDGIGDVSLPPSAASHHADSSHSPDLPSLTSLQLASIPNMDALARGGLTGLMDPVEPGLACGSDTAHLSLLGYSPLQYYRGRGAFESMGAGLPMQEGDIAFKSNFAWMSPDGVVLKRRADRAFHEWGVPLCAFLSSLTLSSFPDVTIAVRYATEHRCGVRLRGPGLTDCISGTDPLHDHLPLLTCQPTLPSPAAQRTSDVVNALSALFHDALSSHPLVQSRVTQGLPSTNVVLFRGAGARVAVPPWGELHGGRAFAVAPTAIIAGLAESIGMEVKRVEGATGDYRTDVSAKGAEAVRLLTGEGGDAGGEHEGEYTFGFVHVKAVDDAGHDKSLTRKVEWLEKVDVMIGEVVEELKKRGVNRTRYVVVVTGDHSTPVRGGDHSCEPVPVVVAEVGGHMQGTGVGVKAFDEVECSQGVLGRFPGSELMGLIARFSSRLLHSDAG